MTKICSVKGCVRDSLIRGFCNAHYLRVRLGKDLNKPIRKAVTLEEFFWSRVVRSEANDCWEWTGNKTSDGYGNFTHRKSTYRSHRLSFEWHVGKIPAGMQVDHICHNVACVNPGHMRLATNAQNCQNRSGAHSDSSSGIRGVSWHKKSQKWRAYAGVNGEQYHLGYFDSIEDAEKTVISWRREHMPYSVLDQKKEAA